MTINPKENPKEALTYGIKLIKSNDWETVMKLANALIKFNHLDYCLDLSMAIISNPITLEKSKALVYIS